MRATVSKCRSDQHGLRKKSYRCSLSPTLAGDLEKEPESHVRVSSETRDAYYVVDEIHDDEAVDFRTRKKGRERVGVTPGDDIDVTPIVPADDFEEAWFGGGMAETLRETSGADLFISCPHGGDVEYNTDEMGAYLHRLLRGRGVPATAWLCHGFHSHDEHDAFTRWHVKKPVKAVDAYPKLQRALQATYTHAVGFHLHTYDYVAVGGLADAELRDRIGAALRAAIPDRYEVRTAHDEMELTGTAATNSVNYAAESNQGVQIELPRALCYERFHTVPEAVCDVFEEVLSADDDRERADD